VGCHTGGTAWFHLCRHMNSHGGMSLILIDGITLQDVKNGVWCAVSAPKVIGLMSIRDHKDAQTCDTH